MDTGLPGTLRTVWTNPWTAWIAGTAWTVPVRLPKGFRRVRAPRWQRCESPIMPIKLPITRTAPLGTSRPGPSRLRRCTPCTPTVAHCTWSVLFCDVRSRATSSSSGKRRSGNGSRRCFRWEVQSRGVVAVSAFYGAGCGGLLAWDVTGAGRSTSQVARGHVDGAASPGRPGRRVPRVAAPRPRRRVRTDSGLRSPGPLRHQWSPRR